MGRIFTQEKPDTMLWNGSTEPVDFSAFKTKPTLRSALTLPALNVAKGVGQAFARSTAAAGASLTAIPERARAVITNTPEAPGTGTFTPVGRIQKAIYGTDKPISFASTGAEFGVSEQGKFAVPLGVAGSLLDLSGTGVVARPVLKRLFKAIGGVIGKSVESAAKEYLAVHKNVIDTDAARELFDVYKADRTKSGLVQEEAKAVATKAYGLALDAEKGARNNTVYISSGGMGVGKSNTVRQIADDFSVVYDGNLDTLAPAIERINKALDAGYNARVNFTFRPIEEALEQALRRAEKMKAEFGSGRTAPIEVLVDTHKGSLEVFPKLIEEFKDLADKVKFSIIDKTGGGIKQVDDIVDFLKRTRYTQTDEELATQLRSQVQKALAEGRISKQTADGFLEQGVFQRGAGKDSVGSPPAKGRGDAKGVLSVKDTAPELFRLKTAAEQQAVIDESLKNYEIYKARGDVKGMADEKAFINKRVNVQPTRGGSIQAGLKGEVAASKEVLPEIKLEAGRTPDTLSPTKPSIEIPEGAIKDFNSTVARESAKATDPKMFRSVAMKLKKATTSFLEFVQDQQIRVRQMIEDPKMKVSDASNPYQKAVLYSGRVGRKIEEGYEAGQEIASDIVRATRTVGVDTPTLRMQVNEYLQALHAPERNAVLGDGAAGITTKEAFAITSKATPEIKAIAKKVLDLNKKTLDALKEGGVITDELHTTLRERYKNHVPLQRIFENDDDIGSMLSGRGFDVRSTGIKSAVGSQREVADILTNVLTNYEQAILRSEKNIVDNATLAFVRENEEALEDIMKVKKPRAVGETFEGASILEKTDDPRILQMFENGKRVWIEFKDEHIAIAFRAIGKEKLPTLIRWIGSFTRFYSGLATRFNPEFALPNKLRDLQETAVYIAAQKDMGFGSAGKVLASDVGNWKAVVDSIRGSDTAGARLYNEMRELGGTTGGFGLSTRKQVEINVDKIFKTAQSNPRKGAQKIIEYVDAWNTLFEDSTRLTVYKQALAKGLSKERAAFLAKEASINFNKMGKGGPFINALWMFSNASIQGTTKMVRSLANPKVAMAVTAAVGSAVAATTEWNDRIDPDWREKVTKWDRLNGLTFVMPNRDGHGVSYVTIPVSWGIKPIFVSASYAYDGLKGQDFDLGDMASTLMTSILEAYNPAGGSDLMQALTPTIIDVPSELYKNKSWSGGKIKPDFNPNLPADVQYFDSLAETGTGKTFIEGAKKLQQYTGIAISPADMNYAFEAYVGGAGRSVKKTANLLWGTATNEVPPADEFPFLSRFLRQRTEEETGSGTKKSESLTKLEESGARESFYQKQEAQQIWEAVKDLPRDEMIGRLKQLKVDDKALHDRVVDIGEAAKLDLTGIEKQLKTATVEVRAKYLLEELNKTKTPEDRAQMVQYYRDKKILTEVVAKRIRQLKEE